MYNSSYKQDYKSDYKENYDYIPFPDVKEYYNRENSVNPTQNLTGYMDMEMLCIDRVHVGSGSYDIVNNFCKEIIKGDGVPIIPGSSVKGVIRNIAYAVSNSCAVSVDKHNLCKKRDKRCIACDMLGKMGFASRVDFFDFKVETYEIAKPRVNRLFKPQIEGKGIKFYKTKCETYEGTSKVEIEALEEGSRFTGKICFRKLSKEQLELLLFSFGIDESFTPKIGGWKNDGFGSVKFTVKKLVVNGEEIEVPKLEYKKCKEQVDKLREILEPNEDKLKKLN